MIATEFQVFKSNRALFFLYLIGQLDFCYYCSSGLWIDFQTQITRKYSRAMCWVCWQINSSGRSLSNRRAGGEEGEVKVVSPWRTGWSTWWWRGSRSTETWMMTSRSHSFLANTNVHQSKERFAMRKKICGIISNLLKPPAYHKTSSIRFLLLISLKILTASKISLRQTFVLLKE